MEREFKGIWIPKEIWLNKTLSIQEKIFMVEIDILDAEKNGEKHCYATNKYFSEFFNLSKNRCSSIIKELEKNGYILIFYKREGKEIKERYIQVSQKWKTLFRNQNLPIPNADKGYSENSEENNIKNYNNNNNNNTLPPSAQPAPRTDYDSFLELFKATCTSLPKPRGLNEQRKRKIRSILKKYTQADVLECFEKIEQSDFLTGRSGKWVANFDWVLNPIKFMGILEGNYANKNGDPRGEDAYKAPETRYNADGTIDECPF